MGVRVLIGVNVGVMLGGTVFVTVGVGLSAKAGLIPSGAPNRDAAMTSNSANPARY